MSKLKESNGQVRLILDKFTRDKRRSSKNG